MNLQFLPIRKINLENQIQKTGFHLLLQLILFIVLLPMLSAQDIYWSEYSRIRKADVDGSSQQTLITNADNFQGMAVDTENDKIYFLNVGDGSLERSDLDGSNVEVIYNFDGPTPHGFRHLALDVANEKAYICDASNHEVSRVNFDGSGFEVLVSDCRTTHGVTLDLDAERMYYSCPNSSARFIASADLDGTNRDTIQTGIKATGMALDIPNNYLYYFDQTSGSLTYDIRRINLDGTNDTLIYDAPTFSMTIRYDPDEDKLWMMLSGDRKIQKLDTDGTNLETVVHTISTPYDLSLALIAPLPVELVYFDAKLNDLDQVSLEWETASENGNAGFEIQRSVDAVNWENIGFVPGNGTTTERKVYSYLDWAPLPGDNYYRLKQMDFNGKYEYTEIRQVTYEGAINEILSVYPNPTPDRFSVGVFNPKGQRARVQLFSSTGQVIWERSFKKGEMNAYWKKDFSLPQEEMYFVMTQVGDVVETEKILVIGED